MEELLEILRQIKDKWGAETVQAIIKKIDSYPIKYMGTIRRSISYTQADTVDGQITFNMADYGKFVDMGVDGRFTARSPYKFRGNWKGLAMVLTKWAQSKGLNKWAVAKSIQKKGIKPRPFFSSVIELRVKGLDKILEKAMTDYMEQSFTDINKA